MISKPSDSWDYSESLEMLFLFYQVSDELLSENTPDTYALPLHNTITLFQEIDEIYYLLKNHNLISSYYDKYIPVIIDEFLSSLENDHILKKAISLRLETLKTGFTEAKSNSALLERWMGLFSQCCTPYKYLDLYKEEIIKLITSTNNKKDLIYCAKNLYTILISCGYSREFLYLSVKKFFNNRHNRIDNTHQIKDFLKNFDCNETEMEFLILMDIATIEYIDEISHNYIFNENISLLDEKALRELNSNYDINLFLQEYNTLKHSKNRKQKIAIVNYKIKEIDEYRAIEQFKNYVMYLQSFSQYFKHYHPSRQIFKILHKKDNIYSEIKFPHTLSKRPYIDQKDIDKRIYNILSSKALSRSSFISLIQAIQMHTEALDSKNITMILRNFWTALETLFSKSVYVDHHEAVINGVVSIIQKTYILKVLRLQFKLICESVDLTELKEIGISDFKSYVLFFASNQAESEEMKKLYNIISPNVLLRTRLYDTRKSLASGKTIARFLNKHEEKIKWQLRRLQRARNIATHIGDMITIYEPAVNHIHNYFDYVVNYILCKSESHNYVHSVSTLVFESQCDNRIHMELLKSNDALDCSNYEKCLFGADPKLINYDFQ